MKKTIITLSTVAIIGFGSPLFSNNVHAETKADLQAKQEQIQEERAQVKANLSDAESKIADILIDLGGLEDEIKRVNEAIKENEKMMEQAETDITDTQSEIDSLEEEIVVLEEAIEKRYNILKDRVVSYQKSGGSINYLEVIFGSESFGDFISRVTAVNKITESDTNLMEQQEADKAEVEEKQNDLLVKLDELTEMKVELEGMLALINDQKEQTESKMDELNDKKEEFVALKDELNMEDSKLASLEADVKQSLSALTEPARNTQVASSSDSSGGELTTLSESSSSSSAPASGNLSTIINAGYAHLGTPYVWAGKGPGGFDCSGFVSWAFAQGGISIPSSTSGLQGVGSKVSYSDAKPGDIVFFNTYKTNGHVGIYLGGGKFIGAQNSTGLAVADMNSGYWNDHFAGHVRRVAK
ncbi:NlpC/P60 family protein [Oceanobacillus bengalensis]